MAIRFPDSVLAYFENPQVRAGVDAMMTQSNKLPADLMWHEMPGYYRALSAAQRLIIDYALLLQEVWHAVWEQAIPSNWVAIEPDEQFSDEDESAHPKIRWERKTYIRCYKRGLRTVYTGVWLNESGLRMGFGVFKQRSGNSALCQPIETFDFDEDDDCFWQEKPLSIPADGKVIVEELVIYRERALLAIANAQ